MIEIVTGILLVLVLYAGYRCVTHFVPNFGVQVDHHFSYGTVEESQTVSRSEYERELRRFLEGGRGDTFSVSRDTEDESSIMVTRDEEEALELMIPFVLPSDAERFANFKDRLAAQGHHPKDETRLKASRQVKVVVLTYAAPRDFESLTPLIDQMLTARHGSSQGSLRISIPESD